MALFATASVIDQATAAQVIPTQGFWDRNGFGYESGPDGDDLYAPSPWDQIEIQGIRIPGLIAVKAGSISKKIDIQRAAGRDGGTIIERGVVPGKFDVDVTLWTPSQWLAWQTIRPRIYRRVGKLAVNDRSKKTNPVTGAEVALAEASALSVRHPGLNSLDINLMMIASITVPVPGPEWGTVVMTMSCIEYIRPSPAKATKKYKGIAKPAVTAGVAPDRDISKATNKPPKPSTTDAGPKGPSKTPQPPH